MLGPFSETEMGEVEQEKEESVCRGKVWLGTREEQSYHLLAKASHLSNQSSGFQIFDSNKYILHSFPVDKVW